ncbi:hypothetical protein [Teredinibacter franksiae]|uniref:hypothetical protein n=1 Tax=Teredinibacter franksiae TaxID=2761453 RepID=UPI0016248564|nr:hypothetical protein [Teredinibacter franksiae]
MSGSTWRDHPFVLGGRYRANIKILSHPNSEFSKNSVYELKNIGHSHYDSASVFAFINVESGKLQSWWWFDDEPESLCADYFSVVT